MTTHSSWDECLESVVGDPDNDELRLECARHVRALDPARSRFIELQMERAKVCRAERSRIHDPSVTETALLSKYEATWARSIIEHAVVTFYRGFVAQIAVDPFVFLEHGERLMTRAPIQHVFFVHRAKDPFPLDAVLASPLLSRLDSISFKNLGLKDDDVAKIAGCPNLERLLWLGLSGNRLALPAFEALAATPGLRAMLYVDRKESYRARCYHPGERFLPTEAVDTWGANVWDWAPMPEEGRALERRYGYIPWLHPSQNAVDRFDARYFVDQGILPAQPVGSPVVYDDE